MSANASEKWKDGESGGQRQGPMCQWVAHAERGSRENSAQGAAAEEGRAGELTGYRGGKGDPEGSPGEVCRCLAIRYQNVLSALPR